MPLNRKRVDDTAGRHIAMLQQSRHVPEAEKREIRKQHEQIARKVEQDGRKRS